MKIFGTAGFIVLVIVYSKVGWIDLRNHFRSLAHMCRQCIWLSITLTVVRGPREDSNALWPHLDSDYVLSVHTTRTWHLRDPQEEVHATFAFPDDLLRDTCRICLASTRHHHQQWILDCRLTARKVFELAAFKAFALHYRPRTWLWSRLILFNSRSSSFTPQSRTPRRWSQSGRQNKLPISKKGFDPSKPKQEINAHWL